MGDYMLDGIIRNPDNSYELLKIIDGNIGVIHVSKDGFSKPDHEYVNNVLDKFLFNNNCQFIKKQKEYDIYLDFETEFIHYMKDGKEDFEMFFQFNGKPSILFDDDDSKKQLKEKLNKFLNVFMISSCCVIATITVIEAYLLTHRTVDLDTSISRIYSSATIEEIYQDILDYPKAIDLINNTSVNLTEKQKEALTNQDFLQDVFHYYEGTSMQYLANLKYNNSWSFISTSVI